MVSTIAAILTMGIASISALTALWRLTRCIHAWELVDKTELPSGFENMAKAEIRLKSVLSIDVAELSKRTVILALRCPKCGAAKIFRESA